MNDAPVTVIIVNWNGGELLEQCLCKLKMQTLSPNRILVMDNGSTDGSCERAERVQGITVRRLYANLGFAAANNRGFAECETEFIALLNPDAFPEPDWLAELVAAARAHPDFASFGSRQMLSGFADLLDGTGDVYHVSGLVWRNGHRRALSPEDEIAREIFSPCAGAVLYRRKAIQDLGGFDEDFFCYVEDVDLGFRLRLAGHKSMYVPGAVVHHVGSASSGGQRSDFPVYHGHRNLVWTFVKNMPGFLFWTLLPLNLLLNIFTIGYFSLRGQGKVISRAKWDAIKGLPRMWRKRRNIQSNRRASIHEIWRILDKGLISLGD